MFTLKSSIVYLASEGLSDLLASNILIEDIEDIEDVTLTVCL